LKEVLFIIFLHHDPNRKQLEEQLIVHIPPLVYSDTQAGSEPASIPVRKTSLKTAKYQEVKAIVGYFLQTMKIYLLSVNRL
jgi:hypothetical protein